MLRKIVAMGESFGLAAIGSKLRRTISGVSASGGSEPPVRELLPAPEVLEEDVSHKERVTQVRARQAAATEAQAALEKKYSPLGEVKEDEPRPTQADTSEDDRVRPFEPVLEYEEKARSIDGRASALSMKSVSDDLSQHSGNSDLLTVDEILSTKLGKQYTPGPLVKSARKLRRTISGTGSPLSLKALDECYGNAWETDN